MPVGFVLIGGSFLAIVLFELFFWRLFRTRIGGLLFPRTVDASYFRFFTLPRIRVCAVAHTVFLLCGISLLSYFLW